MSEEVDDRNDEQDAYEEAVRLIDQGSNNQALRILLPLIEEEPDHSDALNKAGVAYARLEEMEGAEICFVRAVLSDPHNAAALSNLGNIYLDRGDNRRAIALYEKALKYEPDYHVAHNNLAAAYKRLGKIGKQVEHFKKSQKLRMRPDPDERQRRSRWRRSPARSGAATNDVESGGARETRGLGRLGGCLGLIMAVLILAGTLALLLF